MYVHCKNCFEQHTIIRVKTYIKLMQLSIVIFELLRLFWPVHRDSMPKSQMREGMQRGLGMAGFEATLHNLNQC